MSSRANYYAKTLSVCPNGEMISRSEKFVLMVLADAHQDGAHLRTYPKVATIAEDAMVSERQCQRIFAALERKGVLRREYPNGVGRDRLTFYIFPELDEQEGAVSAVKKPARIPAKTPAENPGKEANKGVKMSPLFEQEGCQKGDRRVTSGAPHLITSNKSNKDKSKDSPVAPTSGGDVELAIDEVMRGCGFTRRRLRRVLRAVILLRMSLGEKWPLIAAAMITAWDEQKAEAHILRVRLGPEKFFGDGFWCDKDGWYWDLEKLALQRDARVGMHQPSG